MKWELKLEKSVQKELDKIPAEYQRKISVVFSVIADDPWAGKKLEGKLRGFYSYPVWPYRVIYRIYKKVLVVVIVKIGHRQGIYK
ncbi:MAG: type II toxin-antitoxin system RelE/ParE family toxin [Patescibacteria group bacterium]